MAFFNPEVLEAMQAEGIERLIHEAISKGMGNAANEGKNDVEVVSAGLRAADDPGVFQALKAKIPGLTSTMFAAALSTKLQQMDFDKILPGDNRLVVKMAKYALKFIVPHIIMGAGDGFGDVINRAVSAVRSNPKDVIVQDKPGSADFVCWIKTDLGQNSPFFLIEYDADKNIRLHSPNVPMCYGPEFQRIKAVWDRAHGPRKEKVPIEYPPGQNNQNNRNRPREHEEWILAVELPCEIIPIETAFHRLDHNLSGISPEVASEIKKQFAKPEKEKSWAEKLTEPTKDVMMAFSRT
ncbi:MAG: hypothetical protein AAB664_01300, partial [Patescibacteria group bacterium]